ncbi:hypothetical protein NPX13_g11357 [Xylaria arbuscula]|uniref:Uncharacterized protein n=1 Tax=Xylaria arbuscula TaxID=114810 RepID=A0A9W8N330_9PEZI|nr:hypothetical protein NPX13_g11357 [Xylaria arbuscula]
MYPHSHSYLLDLHAGSCRRAKNVPYPVPGAQERRLRLAVGIGAFGRILTAGGAGQSTARLFCWGRPERFAIPRRYQLGTIKA